MLEGIVGSKSVERILLFIFVNEQCYGAQIQSLLNVPLTPVQKALIQLEKHGILTSHFEGKTRIYRFDSRYPMREELEALLRKAYSLLPSEQRRRYCFIHQPKVRASEAGNRKKALLAFWKQLVQVQSLSFSAKTLSEVKQGEASVKVDIESPSVILFQEKGNWLINQRPDTTFSNIFRWTLDLGAALITLEHLRYGPNKPVFLLNFTPTKRGVLESVDAHLCLQDIYLGNLVWNKSYIDLYWRIIGPNKNMHLTSRYSSCALDA